LLIVKIPLSLPQIRFTSIKTFVNGKEKLLHPTHL
jgi:hypothetical protein